MDAWRYEPTDGFDQTPLQRLKNFPRHPDLLVYTMRALANLLMRFVFRVWNRLDITGAENIPRTGSFVLVANHSSHLDAPVLLAALPLRKIHYAFPAAASDYFFTNVPKLAFSAVVINAMPFDRRESPKVSLDLCRRLLETPGHILILFPEGTRTSDGTLGKFKPGIGFLAAGTNFPVVPCYLSGAFAAWPRGKWFPRPRKLRLCIGRPVQFLDKKPVKEDALSIAEALRSAVAALIS